LIANVEEVIEETENQFAERGFVPNLPIILNRLPENVYLRELIRIMESQKNDQQDFWTITEINTIVKKAILNKLLGRLN